jgi:hypothetical protein
MSFINEIFKIFMFLPEGGAIDFHNAGRASDIKAIKWKKTAKICD